MSKKLSASGLPLPWFGLLADLWDFICLNECFGSQNCLPQGLAGHPSFIEYQDYFFARLPQDAGLCRIRRSVASRSVDRKLDALLFLLESWSESGISLGVCASGGLLAKLNAHSSRLEESGKEIIEKTGWPQALTEAVKIFCRGFRKIAAPVNLAVAEISERGLDIIEQSPRVQLRQIATAQIILFDKIRKDSFQLKKPFRSISSNQKCAGSVPLGGYSALATHGCLENLLPSQLAWLDISFGHFNFFDLKKARQELLYYKRSDNCVLVNCRHIIILLDKTLEDGRAKHRDLPCQALTLLIAGLLCLWEQLKQTILTEELKLTLLFIDCDHAMDAEKRLLALMFASEIDSGKIKIDAMNSKEIPYWLNKRTEDAGHTQIVRAVGNNAEKDVDDETSGIPGIILKGIELLSADGRSNRHNNAPVWPDQWAATIGHLAEVLTDS